MTKTWMAGTSPAMTLSMSLLIKRHFFPSSSVPSFLTAGAITFASFASSHGQLYVEFHMVFGDLMVPATCCATALT